jgi:hypothetical protein
MNDRAEAMVLASFAAESHIASLTRPYPERSRGDSGIYGSRLYQIMESLAASGTFDPETIPVQQPDATNGSYGESLLGPASLLPPLVFLYRDNLQELLHHARSLASRWGTDTTRSAVTEFFADLAWNALNSKPPSTVIATAGAPAADPAVLAAVSAIVEHEGNLREALSAAESSPLAVHPTAPRGMIVGMVLGAFHGPDAIPDEWMGDLRAYGRISTLLEDLEAHVKRRAVGDRSA